MAVYGFSHLEALFGFNAIRHHYNWGKCNSGIKRCQTSLYYEPYNEITWKNSEIELLCNFVECLLYEVVYKHVMWALPNIPRQTSKQLQTIENSLPERNEIFLWCVWWNALGKQLKIIIFCLDYNVNWHLNSMAKMYSLVRAIDWKENLLNIVHINVFYMAHLECNFCINGE